MLERPVGRVAAGQGRRTGSHVSEDIDRNTTVGAGGGVGAHDLAVERSRLNSLFVVWVERYGVNMEVGGVFTMRVIGVMVPIRAEHAHLACRTDDKALRGPLRLDQWVGQNGVVGAKLEARDAVGRASRLHRSGYVRVGA